MSPSLTPNDREMRLPIVPKGKCLNHPTEKAVRLHLCAPCLKEWEKKKLDYDAYYFSAGGKENTRSDVGVKPGEWVPRPSDEADAEEIEEKRRNNSHEN